MPPKTARLSLGVMRKCPPEMVSSARPERATSRRLTTSGGATCLPGSRLPRRKPSGVLNSTSKPGRGYPCQCAAKRTCRVFSGTSRSLTQSVLSGSTTATSLLTPTLLLPVNRSSGTTRYAITPSRQRPRRHPPTRQTQRSPAKTRATSAVAALNRFYPRERVSTRGSATAWEAGRSARCAVLAKRRTTGPIRRRPSPFPGVEVAASPRDADRVPARSEPALVRVRPSSTAAKARRSPADGTTVDADADRAAERPCEPNLVVARARHPQPSADPPGPTVWTTPEPSGERTPPNGSASSVGTKLGDSGARAAASVAFSERASRATRRRSAQPEVAGATCARISGCLSAPPELVELARPGASPAGGRTLAVRTAPLDQQAKAVDVLRQQRVYVRGGGEPGRPPSRVRGVKPRTSKPSVAPTGSASRRKCLANSSNSV